MLNVEVSKSGLVMVSCEIEFRKALIAKNTVAAKRERKALDKRRSDRPVLNQRQQD